jgi:hypothetical protein
MMIAPRALICSAAAIPVLVTHRPGRSIRHLLAHGLETSGLLLARAALALAPERVGPVRPIPRPDMACVEFYAEAGAPEGALYIDGEFVGTLPLNRL